MFKISADLSNNFSFETRFYENQFFYPLYLQKKSNQRKKSNQGLQDPLLLKDYRLHMELAEQKALKLLEMDTMQVWQMDI